MPQTAGSGSRSNTPALLISGKNYFYSQSLHLEINKLINNSVIKRFFFVIFFPSPPYYYTEISYYKILIQRHVQDYFIRGRIASAELGNFSALKKYAPRAYHTRVGKNNFIIAKERIVLACASYESIFHQGQGQKHTILDFIRGTNFVKNMTFRRRLILCTRIFYTYISN